MKHITEGHRSHLSSWLGLSSFFVGGCGFIVAIANNESSISFAAWSVGAVGIVTAITSTVFFTKCKICGARLKYKKIDLDPKAAVELCEKIKYHKRLLSPRYKNAKDWHAYGYECAKCQTISIAAINNELDNSG